MIIISYTQYMCNIYIYELHPCNCLPFWKFSSVQDAKVDLIHELRALAVGGTQIFSTENHHVDSFWWPKDESISS